MMCRLIVGFESSALFSCVFPEEVTVKEDNASSAAQAAIVKRCESSYGA
jgi:hypothetical protein